MSFVLTLFVSVCFPLLCLLGGYSVEDKRIEPKKGTVCKIEKCKQRHLFKRSPYNRPRRAHRGSKGIALLILDLGARRGRWSAPRPGCFTPRKYQVPIVQEAGWAPGPVWTCVKNLAPTGIRSPDRPTRSQLLYRLSYPAQRHLFRVYLYMRSFDF
jgi:hypothetical protein